MEKRSMKQLFTFALFLACSVQVVAQSFATTTLRAGNWRGILTLNDTTELPFTFTIEKIPNQVRLTVINADEHITAENFLHDKNDSLFWRMPVFDSQFKCKVNSDSTISGIWINRSASKPYVLKFRAVYGKDRFPTHVSKPTPAFGKWECTFSPGKPDSSKAIGIFRFDKRSGIAGTFLTETGDYRFLEGDYIRPREFVLSCFDGSHAFLFKATMQEDGTLKGHFWSGKYWHEEWVAKRNEKFELRDPTKLTWITDSTNVNFTFNDLSGKPVSLSDYKGKVVVIQIMGTWCPNCMDETAWLSEVYKKYHPEGLEVIALAYERSPDTAIANPNIRRLKNRFGADYTFLNTGKSGKDAASESLPFLNGIMSFPTTIYIDKGGNVRMVYTGFNGPATGAAHVKDADAALRLIQELLAE